MMLDAGAYFSSTLHMAELYGDLVTTTHETSIMHRQNRLRCIFISWLSEVFNSVTV